jgi:hypothetical protein
MPEMPSCAATPAMLPVSAREPAPPRVEERAERRVEAPPDLAGARVLATAGLRVAARRFSGKRGSDASKERRREPSAWRRLAARRCSVGVPRPEMEFGCDDVFDDVFIDVGFEVGSNESSDDGDSESVRESNSDGYVVVSVFGNGATILRWCD